MNAALVSCVLGIESLHLGLLPVFVGRLPGWMVLAWLAVISVAAPLHTSILHESLHGRLLPGLGNRIAGHLLAQTRCLSWEVLRVGHAAHHRWNRNPLDRPDVSGARSAWARWGHRLGHLLGGVYLLEVVGTWTQLLPLRWRVHAATHMLRDVEIEAPQMRHHMLRAITDPRSVRSARVDAVVGAVMLMVAFTAWEGQVDVLLCALGLRALLISILDNVGHHGTAVFVGAPAKDLSLLWPARLLLLNGNLHETHHRHPGAHWRVLPLLHESERGRGVFDGGYVRTLLLQFTASPCIDSPPGAPPSGAIDLDS